MDFPLSFYLLGAVVVVLTGMSKGGFAGGLGTLSVPLLTLMIDPLVAAAIMLPILCCMDLFSLAAYRRHCDGTILRSILPAAIFGIGLGSLTFATMSAEYIKLMIGGFALYVATQELYRTVFKKSAVPPKASSIKASICGFASGFGSTIAHAGGPPLSIYLLPLRLDKTVMVGTSVVFFTIVNATKLIPYAWLGQLHSQHLLASLLLMPFAPLGVKLGVYLHHRVSTDVFYRLSYIILGLVGLKLVYENFYPALALFTAPAA